MQAYSKHGGSKYCGLYAFHKPVLFIGDPELMKHICIKDFDHFTDRRAFNMSTERDQLISEMLTIKKGEEWKCLRSIMSPTFTSGKIKSMYPLVCQVADTLVTYSMEQASKQAIVEMKDNFGRFTMDSIASCAFGINSNSFVDKNAEFAKYANEFFSSGTLRTIKLTLLLCFPKVFQLLNISFSGSEVDFFKNVVDKTLANRKSGIKRGDFLDLLLEERAKKTGDNSHIKEGE